MSNKVRDTLGKFAPKSEVPRKVRSVNLTDDAWQWLAAVAEKAGMSRNDYLEALAEGNSPFMEMVKPQAQRLIETVKAETEVDGVDIEKQPDAELYPFIETVLTEVESAKLELEAVRAENQLLQLGKSEIEVETLNQELASLRSQLETERVHREKLETELADLKQNPATASIDVPEPEHIEFLKCLVAKKDPLISSDLWQEIERLKESHRRLRLKMGAERRESIEKISDLEDWNKGLTRRVQEKQIRLDELEAQLEQERADREEVEVQLAGREKQIEELRSELSDLKQKSAAASIDLPEAAEILNQLKSKRKKSKTDLADLEAILEILES